MEATPALWAVAGCAGNVYPHWRQDLRLCLRKSQNLPLENVWCGLTEDSADHDTATQVKIQEEFMEDVGSHSHRWRALMYSGHCSDRIAEALERPAPLLEALEINIWTSLNERDKKDPRRLQVECGRLLTFLEVQNACIRWTSLSGLPTLSISKLVNRDRFAPPAWRDLLPVSSLLSILDSCPELEYLELEEIWSDVGDYEDNHENWPQVSQTSLSSPPSASHHHVASKIIHLPRLEFLWVSQARADLALAIASRVQIGPVDQVMFSPGRGLLRALNPHNHSDDFLESAFKRAVRASGRLHLSVGRYVVKMDNQRAPWLDPLLSTPPERFTFEDFMTSAQDLESTLDLLDGRFSLTDLHVPLHLHLGHPVQAARGRTAVAPPPRVIGAMSSLEVMDLFAQVTNVREILEYLSEPQEIGPSGRRAWPCSRLKSLRIKGYRGDWEDLLLFLQRRYVDRGAESDDLEAPCDLDLLTFEEPHPGRGVLDRIEGIGEVRLITEEDSRLGWPSFDRDSDSASPCRLQGFTMPNVAAICTLTYSYSFGSAPADGVVYL